MQIPPNSKDNSPRLQGLTSKVKQKETKQSIIPELRNKNEHKFNFHGPQEENLNDEFEREGIADGAEVAEEHHKPVPSSHKRVYSQSYHSNYQNHQLEDFDDGNDAAKVGVESPIHNSPPKKLTNEMFSGRNFNENMIKMVKV